jgi:hypothetical protein
VQQVSPCPAPPFSHAARFPSLSLSLSCLQAGAVLWWIWAGGVGIGAGSNPAFDSSPRRRPPAAELDGGETLPPQRRLWCLLAAGGVPVCAVRIVYLHTVRWNAAKGGLGRTDWLADCCRGLWFGFSPGFCVLCRALHNTAVWCRRGWYPAHPSRSQVQLPQHPLRPQGHAQQ